MYSTQLCTLLCSSLPLRFLYMASKLQQGQLYCTNCTVLYCIVLYCTVLYCTVLYCTVHSSVLYSSLLCSTVIYTISTVLYSTLLQTNHKNVPGRKENWGCTEYNVLLCTSYLEVGPGAILLAILPAILLSNHQHCLQCCWISNNAESISIIIASNFAIRYLLQGTLLLCTSLLGLCYSVPPTWDCTPSVAWPGILGTCTRQGLAQT